MIQRACMCLERQRSGMPALLDNEFPLPTELRPLQHQGSSNPDRPHDEAHCQRCQELGHSCKDAPPVTVIVNATTTKIHMMTASRKRRQQRTITCSHTRTQKKNLLSAVTPSSRERHAQLSKGIGIPST